MSIKSQTKRLSITEGAELPLIEIEGYPCTYDPYDDQLEIEWHGATLTITGLSKLSRSVKN